MGLVSKIIGAITNRPIAENCCQCGSDNITVTVWTQNDGSYLGVVQCNNCKRYRFTESTFSQDDALKAAVQKWNDECIFWRSMLKKGYGHR